MTATNTGARVTIGIPAYNAERYLGEAVECFLAQTFSDLEIIISDNASTDSTEQICRALVKRDSRVRYVRQSRNIGAARNYNALVALARTPFFRWAAADDLSAPTSVARCVAVLESDPGISLVYPKTVFISADGSWLSDYEDNLHLVDERPSTRFDQLRRYIERCNAPYGLIRTDVLRQTAMMGSFLGSDITFLAEMALRGKIVEIPERLFMRRMHDGAFSAMTDEQRAEFYAPDRVQRRHGAREWRMLRAYVGSALRTPLSFRERTRVLWSLARGVVWSRRTLARELIELVRG